MSNTVFKRTGAAPAALFTIEEVRMHLRESLVNTANDNYILGLVQAMAESVEDRLFRSLVTRSWVVRLPAFEDPIKLLVVPAVAVTHVKYYDTDGVLTTLSADQYRVDPYSEPGLIYPVTRWPQTQVRRDAVEVEFTAGYGNAAAVPHALKQYILLGVKDMYDNRGATNIGNITTRLAFADHLLDPFYNTGV